MAKWPSRTRSYIPICQTRWQPPAMPSGHRETICQQVWLSAWRMAEGWMRTRRTSASLRIHPPLEYVRRMILMMNHPNSMLFGASAGVRGVLMFGRASWCNGPQNRCIFCNVFCTVAPSWQKVQRKMQCNGQKKTLRKVSNIQYCSIAILECMSCDTAFCYERGVENINQRTCHPTTQAKAIQCQRIPFYTCQNRAQFFCCRTMQSNQGICWMKSTSSHPMPNEND